MEKKRGKVSILTRNSWIVLVIWFAACEPVAPFGEIPYFPFNDIQVNTNLPEYSNLRFDGGLAAVNGGVRGILLYRENSTTYHAIERNCSWLPNDACATVDVHPTGLYLLDSCCGSSFSLPNVVPTGGPAIYPLRKYLVFVNGNVVTITDEITN